MKKLIIIIIILFSLTSYAQTSITINNQTIQGREYSTGWIFENETDSIIALEIATYKTLIKKYKELEAELTHREAVIKAKEKELAAYKNYEYYADEHIASQDSLITMADSLYHGYKDLYKDLKSIADMKKFGIIVGAGLNKYDKQNPGYLFDAGFEYNKLQLTYQFGNDYNGLTVRYRIPLF